ncbi:multicopper oxidase family protein [Candidatus Microgenomates bacterium]|nr:MAG: multicopper oxidase family protein [Candidatus Microgenomates bacterium]
MKNKPFLIIGVFVVVLLVVVFLSTKQKEEKLVSTDSGTFVSETTGLSIAKAQETVTLKDGDTYNLSADIVKKAIKGKEVKMLAYNSSIPGPLIKVPQGAEITLNFTNNTDVDTTVHSHGVRVDNKFDGVPDVTQDPVKPGKSFTYTLKFPDEGVYWYHPHIREDYAQELGLYGNFIVTPEKSDYWAEVDREEALFLDDILITNGQVASFDKETVNHTLMGRFGNTMLINGDENYQLPVKQGERVRFYITNAANTRVFNFAIPNARMKLVGGDSGKYEREVWVDAVTVGPSERYVVEVLFDTSGDFKLTHKTPDKTYTMGTINVQPGAVATSYLLVPRVNDDKIGELTVYRSLLQKTADKQLTLSMTMGASGNQSTMSGGGHGMHQMADGQMMANSAMQMDGDEGPIEWEDTMSMMNQGSTPETLKWKLIDKQTNKENMDIGWQFIQGDKVKISIFNDPNSMHSMQHPIHFHGQRFLVLAKNGVANDNLVWKDTVLIGKGETMDILLDVTNPGDWMVHCHIPEHMEAGMMSEFTVI